MAEEKDYNATIVSIVGADISKLLFLANLYPKAFDSESVGSSVAELSYNPSVQYRPIHDVDTWLTQMDQSVGGNLFVVSMDGELHRSTGGVWKVLNLNCPEGLNAVWAASDDEAFAVGLNGARVRVTGELIDLARDSEGRRFNAVHGSSPTNVFAVGDNGVICHYDGTTWTELESPTNYNLLAVVSSSEAGTYVAGAHGTLFHFVENRWVQMEAPEITITGLAWYRGALYAAARRDGVHVLTGARLEPIKKLILTRLRAIGDLLFGVGDRLVARFDGTGWRGGELDL